MNLFRIRHVAEVLEMERELDVSTSLLFEITKRFQLKQNDIANMFQGAFDSELGKTFVLKYLK